jgi:cysteine-S-conjugate beta-lyase
MNGEHPDPTGVATQLIHHPYRPPPGFEAPQVGVHKASTVIFPNVAAMKARDWRQRDGYTYGLHGTPTSFTLEERIATLNGAHHTLLLPSGLAAVTLVGLALLAPGDELLLPSNVYAPSLAFARHELARFGVAHRLYDPMAPDSLQALLGPRTRLVWLEAPGSVSLEFPDVPRLAAMARAAGACVALDDTWGAGIALDGFGLGADVVVQALTKYASGGGDVLMGAVCTRDDALHEKLKLCHMRLGFGVGANDVEAVLRGLPTLSLRYAAQDAAGRELAQWLAARPEVAELRHPAMPGSPGHTHWLQHARAAAGLLALRFHERHGADQVHAFCDRLRLFKLGYSWAGPLSLVVPYDLDALREGGGQLVRLSVGLEAVADLKADLEQALRGALR